MLCKVWIFNMLCFLFLTTKRGENRFNSSVTLKNNELVLSLSLSLSSSLSKKKEHKNEIQNKQKTNKNAKTQQKQCSHPLCLVLNFRSVMNSLVNQLF